MTTHETTDLDDLLARARDAEAAVSDDLMARVLADAAAAQPGAVAAATRTRRAGPLAWVHDLIGGWPALGGVIAAGLTGLWVGVAPPAGVEGLAADLIGTTQSVTFLPDTDLTLFEESSDG